MKNIFPRSKKGEKIISLYWFAILFIVAAAVVYMAFLFYGKPYDVREIEANLLVNKVGDCFVEENYFKKEVLSSEFKDNFLENCDLNFNVEDDYGWEDDQFLIIVKVFEFDDTAPQGRGNPLLNIEQGNGNLRGCSSELDNFPFCLDRSFFALDESDNKYIVNIFASVRKTEKNVR